MGEVNGMRLRDKTALITGGGRGIGATTAYLFAEEGARVGIVDIRDEGLREVAAEAKKRGFEFKTFVGDVSKKDQVEKVLKEFIEAFGRIDVLLNNAGISIPRPFLEKTVDDWTKTLEINLVGVFLCAQAAAKYMIEQKYGKIIHIYKN